MEPFTDLYPHILHSNVVSLNGFCFFAGLITRLILLEPVSHRLGCFYHVLQLVWVWCRVALQVSLLQQFEYTEFKIKADQKWQHAEINKTAFMLEMTGLSRNYIPFYKTPSPQRRKQSEDLCPKKPLLHRIRVTTVVFPFPII